MVRLKIAYWEFDFEAVCPTLDHDLLSQAHIYIYIYMQTHNILYACTSPELHTYKYGDISSKTVVILPYFVHMHVSFQAKEVDAPKGEEQVFFMTQQG